MQIMNQRIIIDLCFVIYLSVSINHLNKIVIRIKHCTLNKLLTP